MFKCIIIPAFNEYENINILLNEIYKNDFKDLIIIIIDDSDKSFEKNIQRQEDGIIYLFRGKKLGRGSAVLYGIKYALDTYNDIDLFIEMDADMSHNPNELKKNLSFFNEKSLDLLISSRYKKKSKIINWPFKRKILSFLSNRLSKLVLNVPITDYTNGYRIYSNQAAKFVVQNCGKIGDGYIVLSEILIQLYYNRYKIDEVDTIFANRVRGTSNVTISEIFLSLIGLFKIWKVKKKIMNS
tara:strand:- start:6053 stop:6775 length:723 start_codon:yes stop_codon:yes gene_type:complete